MKGNKIISAVLSAFLITGCVPSGVFAENGTSINNNAEYVSDASVSAFDAADNKAAVKTQSTSSTASTTITTTSTVSSITTTTATPVKYYSIKFYDFDGRPIKTLSVKEGNIIDYSRIDTSQLHRHLDTYTEQEFSSWSVNPEIAKENTAIYALSKTATISLESLPEKTVYFSHNGNVSSNGMKVIITIKKQLPEKDDSGKFKEDITTVDITSSCTLSPAKLNEAFAESKTANIKICPISTDKPIGSYTIKCMDDLGDVNHNGRIDAVDASKILQAYADASADDPSMLTPEFIEYADVNRDSRVDSRDAVLVLMYYATASAHEIPDWEQILSSNNKTAVN